MGFTSPDERTAKDRLRFELTEQKFMRVDAAYPLLTNGCAVSRLLLLLRMFAVCAALGQCPKAAQHGNSVLEVGPPTAPQRLGSISP